MSPESPVGNEHSRVGCAIAYRTVDHRNLGTQIACPTKPFHPLHFFAAILRMFVVPKLCGWA